LQFPELPPIGNEYLLPGSNVARRLDEDLVVIDEVFGIVVETGDTRESGGIIGETSLAAAAGTGVDGSSAVKAKEIAVVAVKVFYHGPLSPAACVLHDASTHWDVVKGE
jgi:hypothetical protein